MALAMLASSVALVIACVAFTAYEQSAAHARMARDLGVTAEMAGANCTAGLSFDEAGSVDSALKSLGAEPDLVQACWYDKNGRLFARYQRNNDNQTPAPAPAYPGYHFENNRLKLVRPITLAGENIGSIYLEEDLSEMNARLWRYALIMVLVLVIASGVAFMLSAWLQRVISKPLSDLAQTVTQVRARKDYSVRAAKAGNDELGNLIDGFNEMLAQIQERDVNLERRVSERTQALSESLSVLNATFSSTADGILVVNTEGKIIFENRRVAELWKFPRAVAGSMDDTLRNEHISSMLRVPALYWEKVEHYYRFPDEGGWDEIELKDGTILERITAPVRDARGNHRGRIWTFRDVTQNRRYQAALRESEANYYSLVDQMPAGIFRKDKDGRYVFVNSWFCRIKNAQPEDFLGKLPTELSAAVVAADSGLGLARQTDLAMQHHQAIMQNGQQIELEEKQIGADGTAAFFHVIKSPVFGPDGAVVGSQGILLDITQRKLAEAELTRERELLRELLENSADTIYFKDLESRFVRSSHAQARQFGVDRVEDIIGKTDADFFTSEHAQAALADEQEIIRTGQPIVQKLEKETWPDGRVTWALTNKMPLRNSDGEIIGTFGISKDITELKQAQERVAREQARLQIIFDSVPVGISLATHNAEGKLLVRLVNDAHLQICGVTRKQNEDMAVYRKITHPDDRRRHDEFFRRVEKGAISQFSMEKRYLRLDGKLVWVIFSFQRRSFADGSYEDLSTVADITAHKQAAAELTYERELLRALLDYSADSIFFKDRQSRYVKLSRSEARNLFAIARSRHNATDVDILPAHLESLEQFQEYVIGKSDSDIYGEEAAREFARNEQEIIRSGQPIVGKVEKIVHHDGHETWQLTTKMPWRDNQTGEIIGTFGTSSNITGIKEAELKVAEAQKQLLDASRQAGMAEVATSVLHNVGNVLNSVNVSSTLVLDLLKKSRLNNLGRIADLIQQQGNQLGDFFTSDPRGQQLPEYLAKLAVHLETERAALVNEVELTRKNIEHIKDIVTMQQSYAKVSGVVEKVRATDLVEDALRMNAGALTRHNVQVARDYPENPPQFYVERQKVLQILVNLIRNAKYACEESNREDRIITVAVRLHPERMQIIVQDNGVGILPENLTRIFSHGFTTREHGHGFGLHSGALAAKEMNGALHVHSDGPGCGATFTLELPLNTQPVTDSTPPSAQ